MKTKKILSLVLAIVMLFTFTNVLTSATGTPADAPALSFTDEVKIDLPAGATIDKSSTSDGYNFSVEVINNAKELCATDSGSTKFDYDVTEVVLSYTDKDGIAQTVDQKKTPDKFYQVLADNRITERTKDADGNIVLKQANPISNAKLIIKVKHNFYSEKIFGDFSYKVKVTGVKKTFGLGMDAIDNSLPLQYVAFDILLDGDIPELNKLNSFTVDVAPSRQEYKDNEKFDLTGVKLTVKIDKAIPGTEPVEYEYAFTDTVTYGPNNAHFFTGAPSINENLTVDTKEVYTYFFGTKVGEPLPVKVEHSISDYYVNITTGKAVEKGDDLDSDPNTVTKASYGYHAKVCEGCGEKHDAHPHTVDPNAWKSNNDATFTENGTESNICLVCGATLTRDAFHTADYNDAFANLHFLRVIFDYINGLLRIIRGAIGKF